MISPFPSSNRKNDMGKQGTALVVVSENTIISLSSLKKDKLAIAVVFPQALSGCCSSLSRGVEFVLGSGPSQRCCTKDGNSEAVLEARCPCWSGLITQVLFPQAIEIDLKR